MPDVKIPVLSIQTIYAGAGPQEVETQITEKIEDAVSTVSNIDYVQSYSMENVSYVIISFKQGKDIDVANQEVKDKVDAIINDLPKDADKPKVAKFDIGASPIVNLVLSGTQSPLELNDYAENVLKDRLSQIPGVGQVELEGGQQREIRVELDDKTVYSNSISLTQLSGVLAAYNLDMPAGQFKSNNQELNVKIKGQYKSTDNISDLDVPTASGLKKLSQIAQIKDESDEVRKKSTYYNSSTKTKQDNVIRINIIKSSDGNPVEISKALNKALPGILETLPKGMSFDIVNDNSIFVKSSVNDTLSNIYMGIILTGLILLFFLYDLRSTLIVAISMPVSIIATFWMMQMAGFSLNIMSLLGLSTSIGTLVTSSVVVIENIFRHMHLGNNRKDAAQIGTAEIAIAVLASTLTNVVVFLPIGSMSSIVGQFFKEFAITVTFATFMSIIVSFTITPMLASLILPEKQKTNKIATTLEGIFSSWEKAYKNILTKILKTKKSSMTVIGVTLLLFISSFFFASKVGFEFMPTLDEGNIQVQIELPQGFTLDETAAVLNKIESRITAHQEVKHVLTTIGGQGSMDAGLNLASSDVKLIDAENRKLSTQELSEIFINELSTITNAKIKVAVQSSTGNDRGDPITLYLMGQNNEELERIRMQVMNKIKDVPGLINLDSSSRSGKTEVVISPKRYDMLLAGTNVYELALNLRTVMEGAVGTQYKENGNEYDIKVTLNEESYNSIEKINNITIVTSKGTYRLSQLADVEFAEGVSKVIHRDKTKTIEITGAPAVGVPLGNVTGEITKRIDTIKMPAGYSYKWGGNAEMMTEAVSDMAKAALLAIILTYMLLAAILESFLQPLMILSTVPLALIGVFYFQYFSGLTMNIFSMMSIIMLVGIVVNNAILILDYVNQLRKQGRTVHDALIEACPTKLKAIIMSNIAIILSMAPMALGIGEAGKEFRQSMGIVSIGGLISSTLLTLVFIPVLYFLTTKTSVKKAKQ
jgi:HAE1 family hydrophobic/amphiphilic exporter-1